VWATTVMWLTRIICRIFAFTYEATIKQKYEGSSVCMQRFWNVTCSTTLTKSLRARHTRLYKKDWVAALNNMGEFQLLPHVTYFMFISGRETSSTLWHPPLKIATLKSCAASRHHQRHHDTIVVRIGSNNYGDAATGTLKAMNGVT